MVQIVKRKKKGRPSKADLARRKAAAPDRDVRRSLRRRNVRYSFDFDDFVDEDGEDGDVEDERREKKLKPLLKLQSKESGAESTPSGTRGVPHAPAASASSSDCGDDGGNRLKKRKINGDDEVEGDADNDEDENGVDDEEEIRGRKGGQKGGDFVPGTPSDPPHGFPLPDKKSLELILDKLQKKDTYGVYAEPVDREELPDYHDVIEHPMDFATVRKKLGNGSYSTLEQFENDVFLICTNAMQYNAPDTIYYKQARSIQELAKKKFLRLRINAEHSENDLKSEQRTLPISLAKKPLKKPVNQSVQEPFVSDFSLGATLATPGDFQSVSNTNRAGGFERLNNVDAPVEGNTSLIDNNLDKAENSLTGRGILSRFGRKTFVPDDNRRATYNISNEPVSRSESIFSTFDGEIKQLVAVGLHGDHSYARSLARFAGTLGAVAWKVASKRIEQALPVGFKYGRGWVVDYEPLPTPVLILENHSQKGPDSLMNPQSTSNATRDDNMPKTLVSAQEKPSAIKVKPSWFGAAITKTSIAPASVSAKEQSVRGTNLEGKLPLLFPGVSRSPAVSNANYQQQSPESRNIEPEELVKKQVELNCPPPSANKSTCDFVAEKQIRNGSVGTVLSDRNLLQSIPMKQPEINGFVVGGLPNGKVSANSLNRSRIVTSCSDSIPKQIVTSAACFSHGQEQQQGLSDPVQLMKIFAETAQKQQKPLVHSPVGKPRGWISIGAQDSKSAAENGSNSMNQISFGSLYNPTREFQSQVSRVCGDPSVSGIHIPPAKGGFPTQAFITPPVQMGNGAQFQNRPMVFPQLMTADLSRLQVQAPCRQSPRPQMQPERKRESLPPDLNIGFQSPGSPVKQPSGVLVDSQQPDLALQL